jgi:hypothetical protein
MGRISLALGLAVLAGCGEGTNTGTYWTGKLTVSNQGTSTLYGVAEDWDGKQNHNFSLDPGISTSFKFDTPYRVKLHAWRASDDLLLIDDFWEAGDLMQGVKVTLNP